jgi:hypothetical protein
MASEKSICIDYAGRAISKILPQSDNSKNLVSELLAINGLNVKSAQVLNGFTRFECINAKTNKRLTLNIYFSNFKFDLERPNFVNINLGTTIDDPYKLSRLDDRNTITLVLGIYVFDSKDTIDKALFVRCPILSRNYKGNPSIRCHIELIKSARVYSDAMWENQKGSQFRGFKSMSLRNILDISDADQQVAILKNQTIETKSSGRSGPAPSNKSYQVLKNTNDRNAVVYVARWGETELWKIGTTVNTARRIKEFNQYIPYAEFSNLDIWTLIMAKEFSTQQIAYDIEQKILHDSALKKFNTSGERFSCSFSIIQSAIDRHAFKEA